MPDSRDRPATSSRLGTWTCAAGRISSWGVSKPTARPIISSGPRGSVLLREAPDEQRRAHALGQGSRACDRRGSNPPAGRRSDRPRRVTREAVIVTSRQRDAQGRVISQEERHAHRTRWVIEKVSFFAERVRMARRLRDEQADVRESVRAHPELKSTFLTVRAAEEVAAQRIANPEDRERFIELVRAAIAGSVRKGEPLPTTSLRNRSAGASRGADRTHSQAGRPHAMTTPAARPSRRGGLERRGRRRSWLKRALREALERDPVDALNDALFLAGILEDRLRSLLGLDDPD